MRTELYNVMTVAAMLASASLGACTNNNTAVTQQGRSPL